MCKVAVVILNWNGADMMRRYLPSVIDCSHCEGHEVEVIVADNASTDESVSMLRREFPAIKLICLDQNYGFAEGYNQALSKVEADYYVLLNSDVELRHKGWLTPMIDYMEAHADVAACQPKLIKLGGEPMFEYAGGAGGYIDKLGYPYCRGRIMGTVEADEGQYDNVAEIHWATGAAMMARAQTYWDAGGLDSRFFCHMEEIDLCWRIRIMGYKIVCVPSTAAYHLGGATLNQGNPHKTYLNFRNNLLMLYKNLPESELSHVLRMRCLLDVMAAFQFLLKADFANVKAVFKARKDFGKMKKDYVDERKRIQLSRVQSLSADTSRLSILWQYYVKGRKRFSDLSSD